MIRFSFSSCAFMSSPRKGKQIIRTPYIHKVLAGAILSTEKSFFDNANRMLETSKHDFAVYLNACNLIEASTTKYFNFTYVRVSLTFRAMSFLSRSSIGYFTFCRSPTQPEIQCICQLTENNLWCYGVVAQSSNSRAKTIKWSKFKLRPSPIIGASRQGVRLN